MFLALASAEEGGARGILEDLTNTLTRLGGALKVVLGPNLLCHGHTLFGGDRSLARLSEFLDYTGITSEILLASNENNGKTSTEMHDLGNPLLLDVIKGIWGVESKADKDDVGVRVTKGSETVVVLLAGRIP